MAANKKCWGCKRTLVGDSKLGLCPDCINKFGSPTVGVVAIGVGFGIKQLVKNGDKIIKIALKAVHF